MTAIDYDALAVDLFRRTESAIDTIAGLGVQTGITFKISDVVQRVEDELPTDYPDASNGEVTRKDLIAMMARDALTGEAYED